MRIVCLGLTLLLGACGGGGSSNGGSSSSSSGSQSSGSSSSSSSSGMASASHNAGQNCLQSGCHAVGDSGGGPEFYVGGTVYKSGGAAQTNAMVRLYVANTNTKIAELHTDASGNFFTTNVISQLHIPNGPSVTGVNAVIEGPGGSLKTMPGVISDAHCNFCHKSGGNGKLTVN